MLVVLLLFYRMSLLMLAVIQRTLMWFLDFTLSVFVLDGCK